MSMTMKCPMCGELVDLPVDVVSDGQAGQLDAVVDRGPADEHLKVCKGRVNLPAANLPMKFDPEHPAIKAARKAAISAWLHQGAFVAKGTRACTMCGMGNRGCMAMLDGVGTVGGKKIVTSCCDACADGDTHPVPQGDLTCAQWAAQRATQD